MNPIEKLNTLIVNLPNDPDLLAAYLEGQGCTGYIGLTTMCPLATYFKRNLPDVHEIGVGKKIKVWATPKDWGRHTPTELETPPDVVVFIRRFDAKFYPNLERPLRARRSKP